MSRLYGIDDANTLLPDLAAVVDRLRDQRAELIGLRDAFREREGDLPGAVIDGGATALPDPDDRGDPELRRIRLRILGIVDQMQADVAWLDERAIALRDISTGLLDFPARSGGRLVWLCWRSGEDEVAWWHGVDEGFAGRRPLTALPDDPARA